MSSTVVTTHARTLSGAPAFRRSYPSSSSSPPTSSRSSSSLSLTVSTRAAARSGVSSRPFPSSSPPTPTTPTRRRGRIIDMASDSYVPASPGPSTPSADYDNPTKAPSYLQHIGSAPSTPGYALLEPLSLSSTSGSTSNSTSTDSDDRPPTPTSPRLVRFDNACVLIPEAASHVSSPAGLMGVQVQVGRMELRMPWGRGRGKKDKEDKFDLVGDEGVDTILEEKERRGVIRVPIPLFRRRSSSATRTPYPSSPPPPAFTLSSSPPASHMRKRSTSTSPAIPHRELQSCLVHRHHGFAEATASMAMAVVKEEAEGKESSELQRPLMPVRRPSLPSASGSGSSIPHTPHTMHVHAHVRSVSASSASPHVNSIYTNPSPFLADGITPNPSYSPSDTVPLRACCAACADAMERMDEALRRGEGWEERFTRGARRRRRAGSLNSGFADEPLPHHHQQHGQLRGLRDMSVLPVGMASPSHGAPVVPAMFQGLKAALDADLDAAVRRAAAMEASSSSTVPARAGPSAVVVTTEPVTEGDADVDDESDLAGLVARALRVDEVDGAKRASTGLAIGLGIKGVSFPPGIAGSTGEKAPDSPSAESVSSADSYFSLPPAGREEDVEQHTEPLANKYLAVVGDHAPSSYRLGQRRASPIAEEHETEVVGSGLDKDDMDLFPLPRRSPAGSARSSLRSASGSGSLNGSPRVSPAASTSSVNLPLNPTPNSNPKLKAINTNLGLSPGRVGRERTRTPSPLGRHMDTHGDEGEDREVSLLGASLSRKATPPPPIVAASTSTLSVSEKRTVRALPALPQSVPTPPPVSQSLSMSTAKALPTPPVSPPQPAPEKHHHLHGFHLPSLSFGHSSSLTSEHDQEPPAAHIGSPHSLNSQPPPAQTQTPHSPQLGTAAKRERSQSRTRERSSSQGQQHQPGKRKLSLTAPFIKAGEVLRDAGADVLRGVSSMSGPGVV